MKIKDIRGQEIEVTNPIRMQSVWVYLNYLQVVVKTPYFTQLFYLLPLSAFLQILLESLLLLRMLVLSNQ